MAEIQQYEVLIIGAGKAGKTLAADLGNHGVKTVLVERDPNMIGGTCINVGCIPTKTFVASARAAFAAQHAAEYGVQVGKVSVDWAAVKKRVEGVVTGMRAMNEKNLRTPPSLDFILGEARFVGPKVLDVRMLDGTVRRLTAEKIFINTGTRPAPTQIPGLAEGDIHDSNSIQRLEKLPDHLIILGGGYIALEFAQIFRRLGSKVTIIHRGTQLLSKEDADMAGAVADVLTGEGVDVRLSAKVERGEKADCVTTLVLRSSIGGQFAAGSHVLSALGRVPNVELLNLTVASVALDERHFIKVNDRLETTAPGIWALGDVHGGPQFTHASLDDYRVVKANVFAGGKRSTKDRQMPFALFIEPELARVGITEREAKEQGREVRVAKVPISAIPRAKTSGHTTGWMKAVVDGKTDQILGCAIFGAEAGEMISTVQMAMVGGLPYTALRDAVLTHPTMTEGLNALFAAVK